MMLVKRLLGSGPHELAHANAPHGKARRSASSVVLWGSWTFNGQAVTDVDLEPECSATELLGGTDGQM